MELEARKESTKVVGKVCPAQPEGVLKELRSLFEV